MNVPFRKEKLFLSANRKWLTLPIGNAETTGLLTEKSSFFKGKKSVWQLSSWLAGPRRAWAEPGSLLLQVDFASSGFLGVSSAEEPRVSRPGVGAVSCGVFPVVCWGLLAMGWLDGRGTVDDDGKGWSLFTWLMLTSHLLPWDLGWERSLHLNLGNLICQRSAERASSRKVLLFHQVWWW